jgi:hypothetical protein
VGQLDVSIAVSAFVSEGCSVHGSPEYQEDQTDQQEYPKDSFRISLEKAGLLDQYFSDAESGLVGGRAELVQKVLHADDYRCRDR